LPRFEEHLALHRLDAESSNGILTYYNFVRETLDSFAPEAMRPVALVNGNDLIAAGLQPGPRFKEILSAVEDGQLEGRFQSREEAMEFVRAKFGP
jgi:poly(A) polymerase